MNSKIDQAALNKILYINDSITRKGRLETAQVFNDKVFDISIDAKYQDLSYLVFNNCTLDGIDFTAADLTRCVFNNCSMLQTDFNHCIMDEVKIIGCIMDGADLSNIKSTKLVMMRTAFKSVSWKDSAIDLLCTTPQTRDESLSQFKQAKVKRIIVANDPEARIIRVN